ncbi:hypothetical protein EOB77_13485 [Mesorhizobium sp. M7A.F.Ca.MR.228.00.0.0]|nr:hypothetical protein EOB77_13485 [Mesorhizobium sp. M7A.F.Ca.MR.228.00.0.0]
MADIAILETRERVLAGILLTGAAYLLFSTQDASIKLLVVGMSVWQIMFFRSIAILGACAAIGGRQLFADTMRSPIVRPMLVRSAFTLAAWLCYYNAARSLQLAELTTVYYAAPIIVTVLSVFLLGEKVPMLRWLAVLIGFASCVAGLLLSYHASLPSGPAIILSAGVVYFASILFGTRGILRARIIHHRHRTA